MSALLKRIDPYRLLVAGVIAFALFAAGANAWRSHKTTLIDEGRAQCEAERAAIVKAVNPTPRAARPPRTTRSTPNQESPTP